MFTSSSMKRRLVFSLLLPCLAGHAPTARCAGGPMPARFGIQHCVTEWSYTSAKTYTDPFNDLELDVLITDSHGHEQRVPAFWAGETTWQVRFAPDTTGKFPYARFAATPTMPSFTASRGCWKSRLIWGTIRSIITERCGSRLIIITLSRPTAQIGRAHV